MSEEINADYVRAKFLIHHKNVVESLVQNDNDLTEQIDTWKEMKVVEEKLCLLKWKISGKRRHQLF